MGKIYASRPFERESNSDCAITNLVGEWCRLRISLDMRVELSLCCYCDPGLVYTARRAAYMLVWCEYVPGLLPEIVALRRKTLRCMFILRHWFRSASCHFYSADAPSLFVFSFLHYCPPFFFPLSPASAPLVEHQHAPSNNDFP